MPAVFEIEQALLLLEIEPPFDQRDVQLARRRLAKVWHPDLAPPGRQFEHERHLKAINDAADQLISLAEGSRGGRVSRNAVKVSAAASRKARAEEGRRAYEAEQRARAAAADQAKHDPFGSRMPDHSVVHRYARCLSYPEWGVGSVTGIYFTGAGDDVQQWARVKFAPGVRTVPAGSLQFVDFSKPDPGAERVQRFMTAAQHAMAEGDYPLAAKRLIFARDAEPTNAAVLRLMTLAFWQAGELDRRGPRRARLGARRGRSPRAASLRRAHLRGHGRDRPRRRGGRPRRRARPAGRRRVGARRAPAPAAHGPRGGASARSRWRAVSGPSVEGLLDLALAHHLAGDLGAEVTATEQATLLEPSSAPAWARYAHALARTDRISDAIAAAERALDLNRNDGEVADLLDRLRAALPRVLPAA